MSCLGNFADLIAKIAYVTRFANVPHATKWLQLLIIPLAFGLTSFLGIVTTSASAVIFPDIGLIWNPLEVMNLFLINPETGFSGTLSD